MKISFGYLNSLQYSSYDNLSFNCGICENRFTIMQWIYIDVETQKIYEYDIANEKLIEFK